MYRAFDLSLRNWGEKDQARFRQSGIQLMETNASSVIPTLESFLRADGSLDGEMISRNWFPQITADAFICHSHDDEEIAISLAGWLNETFGLESFIDSCIWGYADDLLLEIDNSYCRNEDHRTYNYRKRNRSTSHVHAMLSTALAMMIDKTECAILVNTPKSITSREAIRQTKSPWIFTEVNILRTIQQKPKESHRRQIRFAKSLKLNEAIAALEVTHPVDLSSLTAIDSNTLSEWESRYDGRGNALDVLYEVAPSPD